MSKSTRNILLFVFSILIFICLPILVKAQTDLDEPPPPCGDPFDPACPIDGGLTILLSAAIVYGVTKYKASPKSSASF